MLRREHEMKKEKARKRTRERMAAARENRSQEQIEADREKDNGVRRTRCLLLFRVEDPYVVIYCKVLPSMAGGISTRNGQRHVKQHLDLIAFSLLQWYLCYQSLLLR
jgi:hypothetical protein